MNSYSIIDIHTHCYPDSIAPRAIQNVTSRYTMIAHHAATVSSQIECLQQNAVSAALNLPLALSPDNERGLNCWAAQINAEKSPVYSFGSIHPTTPSPRKILKWIQSLGLLGIKLHPEYQMFSPADTRYYPIYEVCEELGIQILFHAGKDLCFPNELHSRPAHFAKINDKFPGLRMILAHLGGWQMWEESVGELAGRNIKYDLAYVPGRLPYDQLAHIIRKLGIHNVMFGTDSPWTSLKTEIEEFLKTPLTESEFQSVFYDNAKQVLQI